MATDGKAIGTTTGRRTARITTTRIMATDERG
jgi:hypothetical protein